MIARDTNDTPSELPYNGNLPDDTSDQDIEEHAPYDSPLWLLVSAPVRRKPEPIIPVVTIEMDEDITW